MRQRGRSFNRLIMLDFGMRPSPASTRCGPSCVATSIRVTVGRLWRKDDRNPN